MATFFIKRLRPTLQEKAKWAPLSNGAVTLKLSDYDDDGQIDAANPYDAWSQMRANSHDLRVGDVIGDEKGTVYLCRYSGFDEAQWAESAETMPSAMGIVEEKSPEPESVA